MGDKPASLAQQDIYKIVTGPMTEANNTLHKAFDASITDPDLAKAKTVGEVADRLAGIYVKQPKIQYGNNVPPPGAIPVAFEAPAEEDVA